MKQDLELDAAAGSENEALRLWAAWSVPLCRDRATLTCLLAASVAAASGRLRLLEAVLTRARSIRRRRLPIEEALLQSYLFAGYPRAIEALTLLSDVWPSNGRPASLPSRSWPALGRDLCRRVYGGSYDRMRANITRAHPHLAVWMVDEGYGKVLSRRGLDPVSRELCAVGALAVLHAPRQLEAHLRGARNVGATPREIALAVRLAALGCGSRVWRLARKIALKERSGRA